MTNTIKNTVTDMPTLLWQSLTWDSGKELSEHARFTVESGVKVFFADPHSPWQRGAKENTNGLLQQYFPKGTDLSRWSPREIQTVANALNSRPRKTLGWKTSAEVLDEYLQFVQQSSVARTGLIRLTASGVIHALVMFRQRCSLNPSANSCRRLKTRVSAIDSTPQSISLVLFSTLDIVSRRLTNPWCLNMSPAKALSPAPPPLPLLHSKRRSAPHFINMQRNR